MTDQRFIIEMGIGADLHGGDYTKAAIRAVEDAMRKSSIPLFGSLGISHEEMRVLVTIGIQEPDRLDLDAVAKIMPRGKAEVRAVTGGLNPTGSDMIVATASVEAFLPYQGERFTKG